MPAAPHFRHCVSQQNLRVMFRMPSSILALLRAEDRLTCFSLSVTQGGFSALRNVKNFRRLQKGIV